MIIEKRMESSDENGQEVTRLQTVTNSLFVGRTAELLKLVKKEAK